MSKKQSKNPTGTSGEEKKWKKTVSKNNILEPAIESLSLSSQPKPIPSVSEKEKDAPDLPTPKMETLGGKINGLITIPLSPAIVKPACAELKKIFKFVAEKKSKKKSLQEQTLAESGAKGKDDYVASSNMQEFGISFVQADRHNALKQLPAERFPETSRLIHDILRQYSAKVTNMAGETEFEKDGTPRYSPDRMNVIIRHYGVGSQIPYHVDRVNLFAQQVWSCVVTCNDAKSGLHYQIDGKDVPLSEQPGLVAIQTGDARFKYAHGVPPLPVGERISITWRWFTKQACEELKRPVEETDHKMGVPQSLEKPKETQRPQAAASSQTIESTTVRKPQRTAKSRSRVQGSWASK